MQRLREDLAQYRELSEPLQRGMRKWWQGPGRLWIVAIAALGFLYAVSSALVASRNLLGIPPVVYLTTGRIASSLMFLVTVVGWYRLGDMRRRVIAGFADEAAMPSRPGMAEFSYTSGLFSGWPLLLAFFIANLLSVILFLLVSPDTAAARENFLQNLHGIPGWIFPLVLVSCLSLAMLHSCRHRWASHVFLGLLVLSHLAIPLPMLLRQGNNLARLDFLQQVSPWTYAYGTAVALLLLALVIAGNYHGRSRLQLAVLAALAVLRIVEKSADLLIRPSPDSISGHHPLAFLRGAQLAFEALPFSYRMHTFTYATHAEGMMALELFWSKALAIRVGPTGILLALLLNLLWLVCVFLFCRWAVGRSAVREG